MKHKAKLFYLLIVAVILLVPQNGTSCGPYFPDAVFTYPDHPGAPLKEYGQGNLGVILPQFEKSYLVVAYRHLTGRPLKGNELDQAIQFWQGNRSSVADQKDPIPEWLKAREKVTHESATQVTPPQIVTEKQLGQYQTYPNCLPDAFRTAALTLKDRAQRFGEASKDVHEWLAGQDTVFENCGNSLQIPAAVPEDSPQWLKADRQYQIAAAYFYSSQFDQAAQQFDRIAADQNSPWRAIAPYLAARAFIRKATVKQEEADIDPSALQEARERLLKLMNDSRRREIHPAATKMLALVDLKLNPQDRMRQLSTALSGPAPDPNWLQDMIDYKFGWSSQPALQNQEQANGQKQANPKSPEQRDDLSDWITTFQSKDKDSGRYAVNRWRKDHAMPWLVAAIARVNAGEAGAGEVAQAASQIGANSPAYPTVTYHRIRLLMQAAQYRQALALYEQAVPRLEKTLTASSLNMFLDLRTGLAASPQDFFAHAALPLVDIYQGDALDYEIWDRQCAENEKCPAPVDVIHDKPQPKEESRFTFNSAFVLNTGLPVDMLAQGAQGQELPAKLRGELAVSTWTRAVLLKNFETADAMVPAMAKGFPETAEALKAYSAASSAGKGRAALLLMLHFPGMRPYVNWGLPRSTDIGKIDSFRDNWWCEN